jgi:GNAT superfamily N-acetyltransferase
LWSEAEALHASLHPNFFRKAPESRGKKAKGIATELVRVRDALELGNQVTLVAEDVQDRVCGLAHVRIYDTPPQSGLVQLRRGHVDDLVVAGGHRRGGCGRALMETAATWARAHGAQQLLLTVWDGNASAERFYAKLGYRRISQVLGTDL